MLCQLPAYDIAIQQSRTSLNIIIIFFVQEKLLSAALQDNTFFRDTGESAENPNQWRESELMRFCYGMYVLLL